MQMGYDFNAAWPGGESTGRTAVPGAPVRPAPGPGPESEASAPRQPDWAGLRARFLALHALRRTIAAAEVAGPASGLPEVLPAGGFADAGESVLSACRSGPAVNPVYWANLKEDSTIIRPVAASPTRGDRGMA